MKANTIKMGCKASYCQDPNEFLLTHKGVLNETSTVSSPVSHKSTTPSLETDSAKGLMPFERLRRMAKCCLRDRPNYMELMDLISLWNETIYSKLELLVGMPEDLNTRVGVDSEGSSFFIIHEVDGIRNFSFIRDFCMKMNQGLQLTKSTRFNQEYYEYVQNFLRSLSPLTVSFYLTLGSELDCGIGINKPMNHKNLSQFLLTCPERESISRWCYLKNQPIPINFTYSMLFVKKTCKFYIFDGHKNSNFDRGFSIFDFFGAPLEEAVSAHFRRSRSDEIVSFFTLDENRVTTLGIEVQGLESTTEIARKLDAPFDEKKWVRFRNMLGEGKIVLELSSEGYHLVQICGL